MKIRLTSTLSVVAVSAIIASPAAASPASDSVAVSAGAGSASSALASSEATSAASSELAKRADIAVSRDENRSFDSVQTAATASSQDASLTANAMLENASLLRSTSTQYEGLQRENTAQLTRPQLGSDASISAEQLLALAANMSAEELATAQSVLATAQYSATAGEPKGDERSDSYTILMNQDAFFGFYPTFNGLIPVGDNVDFSFYGILWTTPSFGNGGGNDLWTEFGVGAAFYSMDGNLIVKPQLGLTNGALLSGGVRDEFTDVSTGAGSNFADGIVPSLTINYSDDSFEAEFYGGYYAALVNRNDPGSLDFLHTWINAGARVSEKFSLGAHYELLDNTRNVGGQGAVVYQWLGPYVQFKTDNGFFARFTAGADIETEDTGDFYKLTAGFSF